MHPLTETLITVGLVSTATLLVVMSGVALILIVTYVIKSRASNIIQSSILIAKGSFDEPETLVSHQSLTRSSLPAPIESVTLTNQEQESWRKISSSLRDEEF